MLLRQQEGKHYNYPEHVRGVAGVVRRLLWKLGFDPLTVYERLKQVDLERIYWRVAVDNLYWQLQYRQATSGESLNGDSHSYQAGQEPNTP